MTSAAQQVVPGSDGPGVQLDLNGRPDPAVDLVGFAELVAEASFGRASSHADARTLDLAELHPDGGLRQGALVRRAQISSRPEIIEESPRQRGRRLLDVAAGLLARLPGGHRTMRCLHALPGNVVEVLRSGEGSPGDVGGLQTCGSGHACPVCAGAKARQAAEELQRAIDNWMAGGVGRTVLLLTLTVPHWWGQTWGEVLRPLQAARRRFLSGRFSKALREWVAHRVVALEATTGENGPHPHLHLLLFLERPAWLPLPTQAMDLLTEFRLLMEGRIRERWGDACERAGLPRPGEHGVDIRGGEAAAGYVAKLGTEWGMAKEVAWSTAKRGRAGGRTPWAILEDYAEHGREEDARLWLDYVQAFHGRSLIHWSRGAKAALLAKDHEDVDQAQAEDAELGEDLVEDVDQEQEEPRVVALLAARDWSMLRRARVAWPMLDAIRHVELGREQEFVDAVVAQVRARGRPGRAPPAQVEWAAWPTCSPPPGLATSPAARCVVRQARSDAI